MPKSNVTLNVAGIPVKIKVATEDEGYIRKGAKTLNNIVAEYNKGTPEKEYGYYLALAALQCAARAIQLKEELDALDACNKKLGILLDGKE